MAREEHAHKCSSTSSCAGGGGSGSGGNGCAGGGGGGSRRSSQRLKEKKVPQRGLGVAQLEKLRLEEQKKKEGNLPTEGKDGIFPRNHGFLFSLDSSSSLSGQWRNPTSRFDDFRQRPLLSCSSSMVNASSGVSPLSSVMDYQMEPPSNQSYYANSYASLCQEQEKSVNLKRQYPFDLEIPYHSRLLSTLQFPSTRLGESASSSNVLLAQDLQGSNNVIRGSSSSTLQLEPNPGRLEPNPGRAISGNGSLDYGFLTLAPPAATPRASEERVEDHIQMQRTSESTSVSPRQAPFFCFLPETNLETSQITSGNNSSREVGKSVDLNLKL